MSNNYINGCTSTQIEKGECGKRKVFNALLEGRTLSLLDSREFELSEFHTTITKIRKEIAVKLLPYTLKSEWFEFAEGRRAKRYWIENEYNNINQ